MSQGDKSALYKALTQAGWKPEKHYREYSTADLESIANQMLGEAARTKPTNPEPKGPIRQEQPRGRQEQPRAAAPVREGRTRSCVRRAASTARGMIDGPSRRGARPGARDPSRARERMTRPRRR